MLQQNTPQLRERGLAHSRDNPQTLTRSTKGEDLNKSLDSRMAHHWAKKFSKQKAASVAKTVAPTLLALTFATAAHAQGQMDFSGATTLMNTFKTFAIYAGAVICFAGLIFAGIRMLGGRFSEAIPGLFGALFGAGVLGWGAGWIGSLTGQTLQ